MKYSQTEHLISGLAEVAKALTIENVKLKSRLARYESLSKKASTYINLISRPIASTATPEPESCHPDESLENAYVNGQEVHPYEDDYLPEDIMVHGQIKPKLPSVEPELAIMGMSWIKK